MTTSTASHDERPHGLRRLAIRTTLAAVLFVLVGSLLGSIDWAQVGQSIKSLGLGEVLVLATLGLARLPTEAMMFSAIMPGLTLRNGIQSWLVMNIASTFFPPPAPSVIQYGLFRTADIAPRAALTGSALTFVFPLLGRLALPLAAVVPLAVTGRWDEETLLLGSICLAVGLAAVALGWWLARSRASAERIGAAVGRLVTRLARHLKRRGIDDLGPRAAQFHDDAVAVISGNLRPAAASVTLNQIVTFALLLAALRFVGIASDALPLDEVFAAYALAQFGQAVIPIAPGGLGVVDAVLLSTLTQTAGAGLESTIVAAIVIWRIFYWLLPMPLGLVALRRWTRAHPGIRQQMLEELRHESR